MICQAKSGMGKTAVFVLSVLQQLDANPAPVCPHPHLSLTLSNNTTDMHVQGSVLVLSHARELAYQIRDEFERFNKFLPMIKTAVFFGGVPISENKQQLRDQPPHVIVGTPGRILELVQTKSLSLNNLKYFVVDECDQMLEHLSIRYALLSFPSPRSSLWTTLSALPLSSLYPS